MKHLQKAHCIMSLLPDLTDYANVSESLDGISTVIACQMVWHDKAEKECGAKCVGQDKATCRMTCAMMYQMEGICKWCLRAPVDASSEYLAGTDPSKTSRVGSVRRPPRHRLSTGFFSVG